VNACRFKGDGTQDDKRFVSVTDEQVADFIHYARFCRRLIAALSFFVTVVGFVTVAVEPHNSTLDVGAVSVALIAAGLFCFALVNSVLLREAKKALHGSSRELELTTYPYSITGIRDNALLATLDEAGSRERTPMVDFKARWWSRGMMRAPTSIARAYGGFERGHAVIAVSDKGGIIGRVTRVRDDYKGATW
jgi:hypothetical protein